MTAKSPASSSPAIELAGLLSSVKGLPFTVIYGFEKLEKEDI